MGTGPHHDRHLDFNTLYLTHLAEALQVRTRRVAVANPDVSESPAHAQGTGLNRLLKKELYAN